MSNHDRLSAEISRAVRGAINVPAEEVVEDDVLTDSDGHRFRVTEVEVKPKTVVLKLVMLSTPPEMPFRCKRGEMVEVERG